MEGEGVGMESEGVKYYMESEGVRFSKLGFPSSFPYISSSSRLLALYPILETLAQYNNYENSVFHKLFIGPSFQQIV